LYNTLFVDVSLHYTTYRTLSVQTLLTNYLLIRQYTHSLLTLIIVI